MIYTILVAEDRDDHREVIATLLRGHDYRVLEAKDGHEAVTVAAREHPDLILLDLSLPVIDGWEAARRMRTLSALAHTPILAVSAHTLPEYAEAALAAGCDDYITKPIALPTFLRLIETHLQRPAESRVESRVESEK